MSLKTYNDTTGNTLFLVRVDLRSRHDRNLRVMRLKRGIASLEEAKKEEKRLRKVCQDLLLRREVEGRTIGHIIKRWREHSVVTRVETGEVGAKLIDDCSGTLKKWLAPYLHMPANEFSAYMLAEVIRLKRAEGISHGQLVKFRRMVRTIYEHALHYRILPRGTLIPTADLKLKGDTESAPEILSQAQIIQLMEAAMNGLHPWRFIWAVALLTGMRSGELYALRWSDLDFENNLVRVSRSLQAGTGMVKSTKAGYWRDVPMSSELRQLLLSMGSEQSPTDFVFERMREWTQGNQAKVLRDFCVSHGLPSIRFHTLRACFATQLLRNGVEAAKVMKVGGWRDLSTMQRYVRFAGIEVTGVTDKLSVLPSLRLADVGAA